MSEHLFAVIGAWCTASFGLLAVWCVVLELSRRVRAARSRARVLRFRRQRRVS